MALPKVDKVSAGLADQVAFTNLVKQLKVKNPICVEIGSYIGITARALLLGGAEHVYCIDLWSGGPEENKEEWNWKVDEAIGKEVLSNFCNNVPLLSKITPIVGASVWWALRWPFRVDLILIDGNHQYESVKNDLQHWWDNLKYGGIFCGHDYGTNCPGVIQAVNEFCNEVLNIDRPGLIGHSVWYVEKAFK